MKINKTSVILLFTAVSILSSSVSANVLSSLTNTENTRDYIIFESLVMLTSLGVSASTIIDGGFERAFEKRCSSCQYS